jgi:hypothetical protein
VRHIGLPSKVRDFQNVIAKVRREKIAGTTVEERLDAHLRGFVKTPGNWATVYVDPKTKETQSVAYQSARMQRLFAAGPQVVMVDCTHGTNDSRFTLFSFVVHDLFGKVCRSCTHYTHLFRTHAVLLVRRASTFSTLS